MHNHKKIVCHKNLELFYGDILNRSSIKNAMNDVDTVYHLAAILDYTAPKKLMREINVEGTKNILEIAKGKKIIFMSSTAVMGKKLQKIPADEKTYCKPTNVYGQTKKDAEKLVLKSGGIVIRAPPVYGKGFDDGYFDICDQLMKGDMYIIGDGKNRIQHIHKSDLVNALLLAKDKGRPGEIYIVAGSDIQTQEEILTLTAKLLGVQLKKKHISLEIAKFLAKVKKIKSKIKSEGTVPIEEYIDVLASDRIFDISKARLELGFDPKIKYEQGANEVILAYKKKRRLN